MSKFIIRVDLTGYREYEVKGENKEQARDNYLEEIGEGEKVTMLNENVGKKSWIANITKKEDHLHC